MTARSSPDCRQPNGHGEVRQRLPGTSPGCANVVIVARPRPPMCWQIMCLTELAEASSYAELS